MDLIGGALPNVMFLIGIIIIGAAIGIQFKVVEIDAQLSKGGRIAAFVVGAALIATSIYLHINPQPGASPSTAGAPPASAPSPAPATTEPPAIAPGLAENAIAPVSIQVSPTAAPAVPTAAEGPPAVAPVTQGTNIVPDVRDKKSKEAHDALERAGLRAVEQQTDCATIGAVPELVIRAKRDRIMCQFPAPGSRVTVDTLVYYVVAGDSGGGGGGGDDDDDDDG